MGEKILAVDIQYEPLKSLYHEAQWNSIYHDEPSPEKVLKTWIKERIQQPFKWTQCDDVVTDSLPAESAKKLFLQLKFFSEKDAAMARLQHEWLVPCQTIGIRRNGNPDNIDEFFERLIEEVDNG